MYSLRVALFPKILGAPVPQILSSLQLAPFSNPTVPAYSERVSCSVAAWKMFDAKLENLGVPALIY
jgi:hypothetical protein